MYDQYLCGILTILKKYYFDLSVFKALFKRSKNLAF